MKKINSELKFNSGIFKVKIGTTNKKHPDTIYIEIGTYISPTEEKKSYKNEILSLDSDLRKYMEGVLASNDYLKKDFILVTDCPYERMETKKKSYFELQLFIKPDKKLFDVGRFSDMASKIKDLYIEDIVSKIQNCFDIKGFNSHKTRK